MYRKCPVDWSKTTVAVEFTSSKYSMTSHPRPDIPSKVRGKCMSVYSKQRLPYGLSGVGVNMLLMPSSSSRPSKRQISGRRRARLEIYPNCASDCGRSLLGDSFACLSSCQPVRTTTKCPCGGATPRPTISRKPTPQPTAAGPRPTGQPGAGTCCFDSPTGDPCECNSIAPPDNWCAPSEERCTSCQGAGNWCPGE